MIPEEEVVWLRTFIDDLSRAGWSLVAAAERATAADLPDEIREALRDAIADWRNANLTR